MRQPRKSRKGSWAREHRGMRRLSALEIEWTLQNRLTNHAAGKHADEARTGCPLCEEVEVSAS